MNLTHTDPLAAPFPVVLLGAGLTPGEAANLYYLLHRGELAAWKAARDDKVSGPGWEPAFETASECQVLALDLAELTSGWRGPGRQAGEEPLPYACRIGARPWLAAWAVERPAAAGAAK